MSQKHDARDQLRESVEGWPEAKAEYDLLGPRFAVISELIRTRKETHLSQAELAKRMGVSPSVLSRLESATHSPRLDTLADAARAMGCELEVRFVRARSTPQTAPVTKGKVPGTTRTASTRAH